MDSVELGAADGSGLTEAQFQRVMLNVASQVWQFGQGAIEVALAALYDVLEEVGGRLEWRVAGTPSAHHGT